MNICITQTKPIYGNTIERKTTANSAQAQPEKGMRLHAKR
jgi:hypothetical protein